MVETGEGFAAGRTAFTVHTDVFDGPLDLLLHLVKRDGISLARLEVARIADAYLAYLDRMRELDLAVAADWLVMAATLVHLKALELLPRPPTLLATKEEADPRDALLQQLREYERIKLAASALDARPMVGRDVFVRVGEQVPSTDRPWRSGSIRPRSGPVSGWICSTACSPAPPPPR
ncbi:MAG: segregation/condensation protein A [Myxococcota bacterium]